MPAGPGIQPMPKKVPRVFASKVLIRRQAQEVVGPLDVKEAAQARDERCRPDEARRARRPVQTGPSAQCST